MRVVSLAVPPPHSEDEVTVKVTVAGGRKLSLELRRQDALSLGWVLDRTRLYGIGLDDDDALVRVRKARDEMAHAITLMEADPC